MAKQPVPKPKSSDSPAAEGGKSKLKMIIIIVLGILLVAGASVGATWFLLMKNGGAEKPAAAEHAAAPVAPVKQEAIYEVMTPAFVVNFKYEGKAHYLQVSLALMTRDSIALAALKEHMPLLRNRLVMLFSSQDFAALITPAGKEILRQQATATVQELAQKEVGKVVVEQVLFTNFVLQ